MSVRNDGWVEETPLCVASHTPVRLLLHPLPGCTGADCMYINGDASTVGCKQRVSTRLQPDGRMLHRWRVAPRPQRRMPQAAERGVSSTRAGMGPSRLDGVPRGPKVTSSLAAAASATATGPSSFQAATSWPEGSTKYAPRFTARQHRGVAGHRPAASWESSSDRAPASVPSSACSSRACQRKGAVWLTLQLALPHPHQQAIYPARSHLKHPLVAGGFRQKHEIDLELQLAAAVPQAREQGVHALNRIEILQANSGRGTLCMRARHDACFGCIRASTQTHLRRPLRRLRA